MRHLPILFNPEMIRAILEGRKTQTRRIAGPNFCDTHMELFDDKHGKRLVEIQNDIEGVTIIHNPDGTTTHRLRAAFERWPRYRPGDILWARETWRIGAWDHDRQAIAVDYYADGFARKEWINVPDKEAFERYVQQSQMDAEKAGLDKAVWEPGKGPTRWRPSIHMPREAARIFLRVIDARPERLKDITEEGAIAEGFAPDPLEGGKTTVNFMCSVDCLQGSARGKFALLWDKTVKKYGWKWMANPWVWVTEFERAEKPEGWPNV